ncbi:MAG: hypothetical protein WC753_03635 [Candidatus Gracilibacteria bacterium]
MITTKRDTLESTCLPSLPRAKRSDIINAAGSILAGLQLFAQSDINKLKRVFHWGITRALRVPGLFCEIQDIVRRNREQVICLLRCERCMSGNIQLASTIVDEILALTPTEVEFRDVSLEESVPASSFDIKDGPSREQEYTPLVCEGQEKTFTLVQGGILSICPNDAGEYTIQISIGGEDKTPDSCHRYEADVDVSGGGWVTIYNQYNEIEWGYAFNSHT